MAGLSATSSESSLHASRSKADMPMFQNERNGAPITFGIEVEAVLAFHEDELQAILDSFPLTTGPSKLQIVKNIPISAHDGLLYRRLPMASYLCRSLYPSWGLAINGTPDDDKSLLLANFVTDARHGKIRSYVVEALLIAQKMLQQNNCSSDVKGVVHHAAEELLLGSDDPDNSVAVRAKQTTPKRWTLTTDNSLMGALTNQIQEAVGSRSYKKSIKSRCAGLAASFLKKFGDSPLQSSPQLSAWLSKLERIFEAQHRVWDSAGFELISPILRLDRKEEEYEQISKYMASLSAQNTSVNAVALNSAWAGFHVHIGLKIAKHDSSLLSVLRHLAYILICHEDLISKLHPRSRCGRPTKKGTDHQTEIADSDSCQSWSKYAGQNMTSVLEAEAANTSFTQVCSNKRFFLRRRRIPFDLETKDPEMYYARIRENIFGSNIAQLSNLVTGLQRRNANATQKPSARASGYRSAMQTKKIKFFRGYMYNFANIYNYCYDHDSRSSGSGASLEMDSAQSSDAGLVQQSKHSPKQKKELLDRKKPKPTIEFRQHAGTTSPEEMVQWVDFCHSLVAMAERMAYTEGTWDEQERLSNEKAVWFKDEMLEKGKLNVEIMVTSSPSLSEGDGGEIQMAQAEQKSGSMTTTASTTRLERESAKYPPVCRQDEDQDERKSGHNKGRQTWPAKDIETLCSPAFLNLDDYQSRYWKTRYERYKDDRPSAAKGEIDESDEIQSEEFGCW